MVAAATGMERLEFLRSKMKKVLLAFVQDLFFEALFPQHSAGNSAEETFILKL